MRTASTIIARSRRVLANPGTSRTSNGVASSPSTNPTARSRVVSVVWSATTTSTSDDSSGSTKWRPTARPGLRRPAATPVTDTAAAGGRDQRLFVDGLFDLGDEFASCPLVPVGRVDHHVSVADRGVEARRAVDRCQRLVAVSLFDSVDGVHDDVRVPVVEADGVARERTPARDGSAVPSGAKYGNFHATYPVA